MDRGVRMAVLCVSAMLFVVTVAGRAEAEKIKHDDLDTTIQTESTAIRNTVSTESAAIKTEVGNQHTATQGAIGTAQTTIQGTVQAESTTIQDKMGGVQSELTTQHDMIKQDLTDVETHLAGKIQEVKDLVEALKDGGGPPPGGDGGTVGPRFVWSGQEVEDKTTGLFWEQAPSTNEFTWQEAKDHCANLDLGNGHAYRLAKIKDLLGLLDYGEFHAALPPGHPFVIGSNSWFWVATVYAPAKSTLTPLAWTVRVYDGFLYGNPLEHNYRAWCVR